MNNGNTSMYQSTIRGSSLEPPIDTIDFGGLFSKLKDSPSSVLDSEIQSTNDYTPISQSTTSTQNSVPYQRIVVDPDDINQFIDSVDISCLEPGYVSHPELFIESLCQRKGEAYVIQMMNDIYAKYPDDEILMCVMINILSGIEYEKLGTAAITLCMGLIAVGTPLVWEYVTNACDRWKSKEFIPCLQRISTDSLLLKRMIKKVIARLQQ